MQVVAIFALLTTLVTLTMCDNPDFKANIMKCMEETKISRDELKAFYANGSKSADAKDNIKCYMKCMMEKMGHLKNGVFDDASAARSLKNWPQLKDHQAEVDEAIQDCKKEKGANDCETAFKITMCLKEHKAALQS
ncbi:general odorant-binding protein 56h-like [Teleopsis dalmanni]|uniref:general odorant-binding protein 56h-like n=1 Tax=Teleopsis dalmanni TaxID=139649 RepID=UPI000D32AFB5|nr:general odorant-binding protein 56h-like [Teleopsis dalmanni]